ncbi:MAG: hypothetical protein HC794_00965 [Nitrospiraceae bacterium]|nr:hypothetical protein [Nitrospiraceae bacterium]
MVLEVMMGQILIRQLQDRVIEAVKMRAKANGRSTEAEVRAIIENTILNDQRSTLEADNNAKKRSILDFVGIAPGERTMEQIVADIRALRDEWDD